MKMSGFVRGERLWTWAAVGLGVLLLGQGSVLVSRHLPREPEGPELGSLLPDAMIVAADSRPTTLRRALSSGSACTLLVFVSPECLYCQQMRIWWPSVFRTGNDSAGGSVRAVWLSNSDSTSLARFYEGYDLRAVTTLRMTVRVDSLLHRLGIYATPTTYLIDRQGKLRTGTLDLDLPPADAAKHLCTEV